MESRFIRWRDGVGTPSRIVIAGDFCPREENSADVAARAGEITAKVKPFFDAADHRVLQWECAVTQRDTPIDKSGPNHRCSPGCVAFAEALGVDSVLLANNHTGDYGAPGVEDTLAAFRSAGIATVGAGMDERSAAEPLRFEAAGRGFSLFNACEHEFGVAWGGHPGANAMDPFDLARRIRAEKATGRTVVTALHGGHEHFPFPSPRMRSLFRFFAESGSDAVFNCHTHCPLGYEIWKDVPIVCSPGNFYFPGRASSLPVWYIGYVPKFLFDDRGAFGLELLPYFDLKREIVPLEGDRAAAFFEYLEGLSAPLADDAELSRIFDAWSILSGLPMLNRIFGCVKPAAPLTERAGVTATLGLRNQFTCQSHDDLVRNTLLLAERYGLDRAREKTAFVEEARHPAWLRGTEAEQAVEAAAAPPR